MWANWCACQRSHWQMSEMRIGCHFPRVIIYPYPVSFPLYILDWTLKVIQVYHNNFLVQSIAKRCFLAMVMDDLYLISFYQQQHNTVTNRGEVDGQNALCSLFPVTQFTDQTFGNRRPGPPVELIINTSMIFSFVPPSSSFTVLYLKGIHLGNHSSDQHRQNMVNPFLNNKQNNLLD